MRIPAIVLGSMAISASSAVALIPEPDNVFYGLVSTNATQHFTAADTNVVVQARALPSGPALATYTMGSKPALGDYYSIRLSLESLQPTSSPQAFQPGGTVYLTVVSPTGILAQQSATVLGRGQLTRVDLGAGGPDYSAYLKHPADNSPADNSISSAELNAYSTAWRSGQAWPLGPNPIPIGYVTRAGALWAAGGTYVFDSSQVAAAPVNAPEWWATNSPLWWTHSIPTVPPPAANSVVRAVPAVFTPGVPLTVTETVTCDAGIGAYAIEEQPPVGWQVSNISNGGTVDPVNGKVKWGLFLDHTSRVLSYLVTPPAGAAMDGNFAGQGGFDGQLVAIGGPNQTGPPSGVRLVSGFVPGRGFKLDLTGEPGTSQTIETSTNLVDWTTLTTVKLDGSGVGQILDDSATNFPQRFYRSLGAN